MTTRLSRAEQTERNRGLVLEAAARVFLERGYAGATLDAIAEEAGFSKGVVYSQFAGKADLMLALLRERIADRAARNAQLAEGLAGRDGFAALMRANARRAGAEPEWQRLLLEFRLVAARDDALNARYVEAHEETVRLLGETLAGIAARGGVRLAHGPEHTARLVLALGAGVTMERIAEPAALPDHIVEDVARRLAEEEP
jgi:AcrR family transcriptional regulator